MYAIISLQGQQFRVEPGTVLDVDRMQGEPGDTVTLEEGILAGKDDGELKAGTPELKGANVQVEIMEHFRGEKITVFKMKRRKRYRRKKGHRQNLTKIKVTDIKLP
ncbi:MAG: 50S ribosomal protein L21 [Lentisphaeria bacterium]